jgi:hypothetical protein
VPVRDALQAVAPSGGIAAIVGGQRVFDMFLDSYDEFHLARSEKVQIPGGLAIFRDADRGRTPEQILVAHALEPRPAQVLDAPNAVTLTVFLRRPA